jgi:putative ABC transport system permease protein
VIRERIPEVEVFPSEKYSRISVNFWLMRTGLGISFGAATILGLLVGLVMVAQTLYAMVLDRLSEFATLKAIGARESQVFTVLIIQASAMAALGSILGLSMVWCITTFYSKPQSPIIVPIWLSLGSATIVLLICLVSALLPYLRVRRVDPVMVLQ